MPGDTTPADSAAPAEPVAIAVTLTETSIDGLPDDLVAGLVDVTVTDETEGAGGEIDFTLVEPGTDAGDVRRPASPAVFTGGPFPDYFLNIAGAVGHTITTLDEGEYIAVDRSRRQPRPRIDRGRHHRRAADRRARATTTP